MRLHLALGEVLARARRHPEALKEAEAVVAADPKNRFGLDLQARALRDMRQFTGRRPPPTSSWPRTAPTSRRPT